MSVIATLWKKITPWRREEAPVAPSEPSAPPVTLRGRVYVSQNTAPSGVPTARHTAVVKLSARVIRADGSPDETYDLTPKKG